MSIAPDSLDAGRFEKTRQQINQLMEEVAKLSEQDLPPTEFFGEFLQRVLAGIAAPAGAVWAKTPQGNLQLQFQVNMQQVMQPVNEKDRKAHDELLRQALNKPQPYLLPPLSGPGLPGGAQQAEGENGANGAGAQYGNPTSFYCLLAPVVVDQQVAGLVEVWQDPNRHPQAQRGFLGFVVQMANLAALYLRNHQLRHLSGQQQLWTQLETYARQVHASLNPTETAYVVATEGRRLVECDRVSVALRTGTRYQVEAISGADVVEKRSALVQRMKTLFESVMKWGEKLVYTGTKDDSLPPDVLKALDLYLAESSSKLLVVQPLPDERDKTKKKQPRSAILMECFEPSAAADQLMGRLDVVGRHSALALYNAVEHKRIPMRWVWMPLAKLQDGLGGKTNAIIAAVAVALVILIAILAVPPSVVPLPGQVLKMDAKGSMLPRERRWVFSPVPGSIKHIQEDLKPGSMVQPDQSLVFMYGSELETDQVKLDQEIDAAEKMIDALNGALNQNSGNKNAQDLQRIISELEQKKVLRNAKVNQRKELRERISSEEGKYGYYWLRAPKFSSAATLVGNPQWTVLNWDFRENLLGRQVKPSDPLLRLGNKEGAWEVELKIPQKHIGQVLLAFDKKDPRAELDVDLLLLSAPTQTFKGKLARSEVNGEATPNKEDTGTAEAEPTILASVRIEGDDIPADATIPRDLLVTGTEVHAKVRCGKHSIGYSLFYGVWEFIYEKVVFFF